MKLTPGAKILAVTLSSKERDYDGDPYKPVELPFIKTYVNSYHNSHSVVNATF